MVQMRVYVSAQGHTATVLPIFRTDTPSYVHLARSTPTWVSLFLLLGLHRVSLVPGKVLDILAWRMGPQAKGPAVPVCTGAVTLCPSLSCGLC